MILIQTIRIYSQDIRIEFGIEKCATMIGKSGKIETMEGIELPNQENIRTLGENYEYLGILEDGTIKQSKMKERNEKREPQKNKKTSPN